jgi:hypothetical protein
LGICANAGVANSVNITVACNIFIEFLHCRARHPIANTTPASRRQDPAMMIVPMRLVDGQFYRRTRHPFKPCGQPTAAWNSLPKTEELP